MNFDVPPDASADRSAQKPVLHAAVRHRFWHGGGTLAPAIAIDKKKRLKIDDI
jgi:hypothetical protein